MSVLSLVPAISLATRSERKQVQHSWSVSARGSMAYTFGPGQHQGHSMNM